MKLYGRIVICIILVLGLALYSGCRLFDRTEPSTDDPKEPEGPPDITVPFPDPSPLDNLFSSYENGEPLVLASPGPEIVTINGNDDPPDPDKLAMEIVYMFTSDAVENLGNFVGFVKEEPEEDNGDWVWTVEVPNDGDNNGGENDVIEIVVTATKNNGGYTWTVTEGQDFIDIEIVISTENFLGTVGMIEITEEDADITIQWADNVLDIMVEAYPENNGDETSIILMSYDILETHTVFDFSVGEGIGEDREVEFFITGHWTLAGEYEIYDSSFHEE